MEEQVPEIEEVPAIEEVPVIPEEPQAPESQGYADTIKIMNQIEVIETTDNTRVALGKNEVIIVDYYAYPYWLRSRYRWFPWLPRWWWSDVHEHIMPYVVIHKEQEVAMLENVGAD